MSNEELENLRREYFKRRDELNKEKMLRNLQKKYEDKEYSWNKSDEERFGYGDIENLDYTDEYCSDSYNEEIKNQQVFETPKSVNKQIKMRNFKNTKISANTKKNISNMIITTALIAALAGAGFAIEKTYNSGKDYGKKETVTTISQSLLTRYNLDTAPSKFIDSWADAEISKLGSESKKNDELIDKFNSVLENEYGDVKKYYNEYIETGSEYDRQELIQSAKNLQSKLKSVLPTTDFSFSNSKFAYAIMLDPDGNVIDYETLDPNLEVYEAVGLNIDNIIEPGEIVFDGAIYKKYDDSSRLQSFNIR